MMNILYEYFHLVLIDLLMKEIQYEYLNDHQKVIDEIEDLI